MGNPRPKPERLGQKLLQIREWVGISQARMPKRLGFPNMHPGRISEYETGKREPSTMILLAYADLAGVHVEDLINDNVELPKKLPGKVHHGVVPRTNLK
jgi:transcriptional regulator with XRE-family HTH domain